jgi:hypothetical protein
MSDSTARAAAPGPASAPRRTDGLQRRRALGLLGAAPLAWLGGCGGGGGGSDPVAAPAATPATGTGTTDTTVVASGRRSWKMGFGGDPPLPTLDSLLANIGHWSQRAEFAVMQQDLPWAALLAGVPAETLLAQDKVPLANYYRSLGLQVLYVADPNDGLSRGEDAAALRAAGRSLREPAVQALYRDYVLAVARLVKPDLLNIAPEANLVRVAAPAALHAALRDTAIATAAALRADGYAGRLMASMQVEVAWGLLVGSGSFRGIAEDMAALPFVQALGLSSYPYLSFSQPEDMPDDFYSRVVADSTLPVWVVESGWASAASGTATGSPALQARYVRRHAALLDSVAARGMAQLVFADPDVSALPQPVPESLLPFVTLGLTDSSFRAKQALDAWDTQFARPLAAS